MDNQKFAAKNYLNNYRTMISMAYVFAILGTILFSILIIPMCWMIPMTIRMKKKTYSTDITRCAGWGTCAFFFLSFPAAVCAWVAHTNFRRFNRALQA
ncbi:hypothetical protein [Mesoplasma lactucae]|uniref:Uncharacterized protein n=1 Tax=Mesoplasma lactucae ATCC 49193 TaxID=81460 RepID=A0A291IRQ7_9MOLU|nr:hypothetical protein [Mesoplasma lactucae]ATG97377.1 hypothetical protein CP520_01215 [Mesoplasma lactucae ATCC 49193]ATZ20171.1 hypothetical protein MLACT_v1c03500 [Mesoplasma lactucae ATCC 49193]MCL8216920.1 hypothetical protein [Mesoplasma lactucae ATCC 49193]